MSANRVLVVDDDRGNCDLVTELLSNRGFLVDSTCDTQAALQMAGENEYALAVIDYQMPVMNGVELFRRIREMRPQMHGVFLTAYTSLDTVFPAIDAGVERVLAKPVDSRELIPLVEGLVGREPAPST